MDEAQSAAIFAIRNYAAIDIDFFSPRLADIMAFCQIESSFDPRAFRAEPRINDASYGILQILGSSARDRGFVGDFSHLYDLETGLKFGMLQILWTYSFLKKHLGGDPPMERVAAGYNSGVGNALRGYPDAIYVGRFVAARDVWRSSLAS